MSNQIYCDKSKKVSKRHFYSIRKKTLKIVKKIHCVDCGTKILSLKDQVEAGWWLRCPGIKCNWCDFVVNENIKQFI